MLGREAAEKRVENPMRSRVFLTNFEIFGNVVKHCFARLKYLLNLGRKRGNKIVKIYSRQDQISKHRHSPDFLSLSLKNRV